MPSAISALYTSSAERCRTLLDSKSSRILRRGSVALRPLSFRLCIGLSDYHYRHHGARSFRRLSDLRLAHGVRRAAHSRHHALPAGNPAGQLRIAGNDWAGEARHDARAGPLSARHAAPHRHLPRRSLGLRVLARVPVGQARKPPGGALLQRRQARAHRRRRRLAGDGSMSALKAALAGADGRMGRMLIEAVLADRELELGCAFEVPGSPAAGTKAGAIRIGADPAQAASCDVLIDFTRPEGTLANLKHARAMVIGTTGFSAAQRNTIADAAKRIPIVMAANFAVGVNAVYKLAETAARILGEGYDVEIIEAHHRHKVDAPSGTALKLGETIAAVLKSDDFVFGREGDTGERPARQIGYHSIRGGDIVGEHTVIFSGTGERVEVTVRSQSRMTYALGALRAAKWLKGRPSGLYDMGDVLGLR